MASSNRLAGTASLTADGVTYMLVGDLSYQSSTVKRESLVGQDGVHGYKETPIAGKIQGTIRDAGDLTVADINAMVSVTLVVTLANGKTIIGRKMWTTEPQDVKTEEGTFEVVWEGPSVTETLA